MESRKRTILKAITYRAIGTLITVGVTMVIAGKVHLALGVGVADTVCKIGIFYFHERLWERVRYGKAEQPEYHI